MKLPLAYYGDSVLRKKGARVEGIDDNLRQLVKDMIETVLAHNGLGLAAPQVKHSLTLFVTNVPIKKDNGKYEAGPIKVYINPKLSSPSEELWDYEEGCLSIPGIYGNVRRPYKITVEATDMEGNTFVEHLEGLPARVVMHENDHINGVLYIDRLTEAEKRKFEPYLRDIKKKYHSGKQDADSKKG